MRKIIAIGAVLILFTLQMVFPIPLASADAEMLDASEETIEVHPIATTESQSIQQIGLLISEEPVETEEEETALSDEDIALIALVTMAEAEGESEEGKRLVIDTILNRMDSEYFPDTAYDVIYQKSQFSSMWNGRVERCYVQDDICNLVREELKSRTNYEVMFFTAGNYGKYGVPMFQVGNHYFSSYE